MKSLAQKLVEIRRTIQDPVKHGYNDYYKYDYATKDDIFAVLRTALGEVGVAAIPSQDSVRFTDVGSKGERSVVVEMTITLVDEKSGETFTQHAIGESHTKDEKGIPQATTQALRFWAINTFQLLDGEIEYMEDGGGSPVKDNVHRQPAPPNREECIEEIRFRFDELGFSEKQEFAVIDGICEHEGVDGLRDLTEARIRVYWDVIVGNDPDEARERIMKMLQRAEEAA